MTTLRMDTLLLPLPDLRPPQKRYPDESAKDELGAALLEMKFAAVHGARIRIEYVSSGIAIGGRLHVAYDDQTEHGLVFPVIGTGCAEPAFSARHQAAF